MIWFECETGGNLKSQFKTTDTGKEAASRQLSGQVGVVFASALTLSACVGSEPSLGLLTNSAQPVSTPVIAVLGEPSEQIQDQPHTDPGITIVFDGIGIPVQAPRIRTVQLQTAETAVSQPLAVVAEPEQSGAASSVITNSTVNAAPESPQVQATVQTVGASQSQVTNPELQEVALVSPAISSSVTAQPGTQNEGKKLGLLARLFGGFKANASTKPDAGFKPSLQNRAESNDEQVNRISGAHNTAQTERKVTVLTSVSAGEANNGALPGVKSNAELFGLDEAEIADELDANSTQVAALGGLGRISPNGLRIQHEKVKVACLKPSCGAPFESCRAPLREQADYHIRLSQSQAQPPCRWCTQFAAYFLQSGGYSGGWCFQMAIGKIPAHYPRSRRCGHLLSNEIGSCRHRFKA